MKKIVVCIVGIIISVSMILIATFGAFYFVHGYDMENVLKENDLVWVYKTKNVGRGDVVAFYYNNKILVRRIIAQDGDKVDMDQKGHMIVNGKVLKEDYLKQLSDYKHRDIVYPYIVSKHTYFVLGDNRKESVDSRMKDLGTIKKKDIIGKVIFRIWPLNRLGGIA